MIVVEQTIRYVYREPINLLMFADVHLGHTDCDKTLFKKDLKQLDRPHTYGIFNGDLFDSILPHDKRYWKASDGTVTASPIDEAVAEMRAYLTPYKSKIMGIGEGNHELSLRKRGGINFLKGMCIDLGIPYLGYTWILKLTLTDTGKRGGSGNRNRTLLIRGHHGHGSGRTAGRDLTAYERDMAYYPEVHVFCYGHTHKMVGKMFDVIGLRGNKLINKQRALIVSGSYLKTLSDTEDPGYAEVKGYAPVALGVPRLSVKVTEQGMKMEVTT